MSLAWRILLLALSLNVLTVGSVQVAVWYAQRSWLRDRDVALQAQVQGSFSELSRVYSPGALRSASGDATVVRRLLTAATTRDLYEDVIVTTGRPPYEGVYLNPLGAVHRDPDQFPSAVITAGIVQARQTDGMLPIAGGYGYALRQDDDVVGYLWFQPRLTQALPAALPLWTSVVGVLASTLLFGAFLYWMTARTIRRPLQAIGEAVAAVGRGRFDVRVPEHQGVPELDPLAATFNRMAAQVADQTHALESAVRAAVEDTKQKERALVLSARLASIGTLAAGLAHEINNPIGGMQNAVNRLLQAPDLGERQRTYLSLVQDGLQRIARTARRLLDFSPRQAAPGRFALASAIDGARALVEHRAQLANVRFEVDVAPSLLLVHGDQHEIQQVMLNLFLNSLDALEGRPGGCIRVQARTEGGRVLLQVDDDGPGMDPALLGRVFDPFFSSKARPDASGLGMFICYSIVQNHGGEIAVSSRLGDGFHVHIALPAAV
ncbi:MAG: HAMP domain-containing histidine kinase [Planctomycetes bacterium]|nr:HAMP domain-containing histidine kinase [Planctomycetota bacterium]